MQQNNKAVKSQSGNVFVFILLGVALFGALMYMFSRSAQQGTGNLTKQQSKIAAQEILNYTRLVEGAVDRVRRNGCSETEISFENDVVAGYVNPNSPVDDSCHIFEDEGGKLSWATPPSNVTNNNYTYVGRNTAGIEIGSFCGTSSCTDLMMFLADLNLNLCSALNILVGNNEFFTPPKQHDARSDTKFIGDYSRGEGIEDITGGSTAELAQKYSACVEQHDESTYFFYHVLLAR